MNEPPSSDWAWEKAQAGLAVAIAFLRAAGKLWLVVVLVFALLLPGCGPVRPVEKVGLLAPFEGLYRRTGYVALGAMRAALAVSPRSRIDRLPLALDTSRDPVRTAHKLLADGSVRSVIGPLSLTTAGAVEEVLADAPLLWLAPFAVDADGFFAPVGQPERWVQPWLNAVAQTARRQGYSRLVVAGWPALWSQLAVASDPDHPGFVQLNDDPDAVQPGDAVLHTGDAAVVARYLRRLRTRQPDAPLLLGPQGEDPILIEHSEIIHEVYWMAWLDDGYAAWAAQQGVESPFHYLVYRAATTAIQVANGESPTGGLRIQWYAFDASGHWRAIQEPGAGATMVDR